MLPYSPLVESLKNIEPDIIGLTMQPEDKIQAIFAQAKTQTDLHAQFLALMYLAQIAWQQTQFEKGLILCKQARELISPEFENHYLAELYHLFALQYWGLERFLTAHQFWNLSLEKAVIFKQYSIQIECLIGAAKVWRVSKNLDYAYSALAFSMMLAEQFGYKTLAGKSAILLGWVLFELNEYHLMLSILKKATYFLGEHSNLAWKIEIESLKSLSLLKLGKEEEAQRLADSTQLMVVKGQTPWIETQISLISATIAVEKQQSSLARKHLDCAESNALAFNQSELLSELYYYRYELEEQSDQLQSALFYFKKHSKYLSVLLRSRSAALGKENITYKEPALDYKTELLIDQIEDIFFNKFTSKYRALKDQTVWLHYCTLAQIENIARVYILTLNDLRKKDTIFTLINSVCLKNEVFSLFDNQIVMLLRPPTKQFDSISQILSKLLFDYPWWRLELPSEDFIIHSVSASDFLQKKRMLFKFDL